VKDFCCPWTQRLFLLLLLFFLRISIVYQKWIVAIASRVSAMRNPGTARCCNPNKLFPPFSFFVSLFVFFSGFCLLLREFGTYFTLNAPHGLIKKKMTSPLCHSPGTRLVLVICSPWRSTFLFLLFCCTLLFPAGWDEPWKRWWGLVIEKMMFKGDVSGKRQ